MVSLCSNHSWIKKGWTLSDVWLCEPVASSTSQYCLAKVRGCPAAAWFPGTRKLFLMAVPVSATSRPSCHLQLEFTPRQEPRGHTCQRCFVCTSQQTGQDVFPLSERRGRRCIGKGRSQRWEECFPSQHAFVNSQVQSTILMLMERAASNPGAGVIFEMISLTLADSFLYSWSYGITSQHYVE